jgi:Ca2+-transporting ATPase
MTGTDVAKEASAMVLLDDNFATIVNAVREGRRIYRNILRFIAYSITANLGTLVATVVAPLIGLPLPLLPTQILWLNLLCDSLPGLALAAEPAERDIMERPPADLNEGVFAGGRGAYMARHGLLIGAVALVFQAWAMGAGLPWRTMVFTFLVTSRMAVALSVRSDRRTLVEIGPFSNRPLTGAVLVTFLLQLAVVYLPPLCALFGTEPLTWRELAVTFAAGGIVQAAGEGEKFIRRLLRRERS